MNNEGNLVMTVCKQLANKLPSRVTLLPMFVCGIQASRRLMAEPSNHAVFEVRDCRVSEVPTSTPLYPSMWYSPETV